MLSKKPMWSEGSDDASLVGASLAGDREAFGQIVSRYQALIASIAYSATGSLSQSEDLAQETFVAAWKDLKALQDPARLRAWLCGIIRQVTANAFRRQQRDTAHGAAPLDCVAEAPSPQATPVDQAISREEEAILWRSLEQIPETYREPLILFYREGQSVERVGEALGLSEDAVRQRLSRGRKMLEQQVAAFVEGALRQSAPGRSFTLGVMGALPIQAASLGVASTGLGATKGATAKAGAWLATLQAFSGLGVGLLTTYLGYRANMACSPSDQDRRAIKRYYRLLAGSIVVPVLFILVAVWAKSLAASRPGLYASLVIAIALSWVPASVLLFVWAGQASRRRRIAKASATPKTEGPAATSTFEYRSNACLLGWPLIHIRFGDAWSGRQGPVKAWIAVGDLAIGGVLAVGGVTIAPVCMGGLAIGGVVFGGFAAGVLTYAGFGLGAWAMGGFVLGRLAMGACAVGWTAAVGGIAIAHEFAQGGVAVALHANDAVADAYTRQQVFFQYSYMLLTRWLWPTMVLATVPSILIWLAARKRQQRAS
jgi:RNA polymerase sigma factor (sigma-70 family)